MDIGYSSWSATEGQEGKKGEEEEMEISSKRKHNLSNNVRTTVISFTLALDKRFFLCVVSAPLSLISASQISTIVLVQTPLLSYFRRTLKPVHVATCRIIFMIDNMALCVFSWWECYWHSVQGFQVLFRYKSFQPQHGHGVDSISNRNEYQKYS
jgi:hypothetical protein